MEEGLFSNIASWLVIIISYILSLFIAFKVILSNRENREIKDEFFVLFWPVCLPYVILKTPLIGLGLFFNKKLIISKNKKSLNKYRNYLKLGIPREDLR